MLRHLCALLLLLLATSASQALTQSEALALVQGEPDERIAALNQTILAPDAASIALLQALANDSVRLAGGQVLLVQADGSRARNAVSGQDLTLPADAEEVMLNNRLRGELETALAALSLFDADPKARLAAAQALGKQPSEARLALLDKALAKEDVPAIQSALQLARAAALLGSELPAKRIQAAHDLALAKT
ncbi:MAG: urea ABC transporter permease subunit UrtB, partial [Burkholderiaceae bacterium]|nr:urea ABC transporter permease subunit UrtB [Burkholderiaceae bacterium]